MGGYATLIHSSTVSNPIRKEYQMATKLKFPTSCFAASATCSSGLFIEWYDTEKEVKHLDEGTVVVEYTAARAGEIINGKLDWSAGQITEGVKRKAVKKSVKKIVKKKTKKV
jgi:hypothetical protein